MRRNVERPLSSLNYRFEVRGSGFAAASGMSAFASSATGTLNYVIIEDPPLIVGSLKVEHMELRAAGTLVAELPPGAWPFLARYSDIGNFDAIWVTADSPPEVVRLTRFLLGEMQTPSPDVESALEATSVGMLDAHYHRFSGPGLTGMVRNRYRGGPEDVVHGAAVFMGDPVRPLVVVSGLATESALLGQDRLITGNFMAAVRHATTPLGEAELENVRRQIEELSANDPLPLIEPVRTEEERAELRRAAEPWEAVRDRLIKVAGDIDPVLVSRAAAHLSADDALAVELESLVRDPSTSELAAAAMHAALADCGTRACQKALVATVGPAPIRPAVLAAFAQVHTPTPDTVDFLIELSINGDEVTRSATGVVLSRFAVVDPSGATTRVQRLLDGVAGCSPQLDQWFGLLGNAGLLATKDIMQRCLDTEVPTRRRAAAANAMRRMPGSDVTELLVRQAASDPEERVRLACLRALASRDLQDDMLEPFLAAAIHDWQRASLNMLLDVLAKITNPSENVAGLLANLAQSEHEEIGERARMATAASPNPIQ